MAYTVIPDSDIDPDSPLTTGSMTAYRENIIASTPTGLIIDWPLATPPSGFLECDGSAISRTTYAALFAIIGTTYGVGDGSTTFNIPDRRGEFVRGWDHGAGNDPDAGSRTDRGDGTTGDNVGTKQSDQYESHTHPLNVSIANTGGAETSPNRISTSDASANGTYNTNSSGGNETRGRNVYTNYCIWYMGN